MGAGTGSRYTGVQCAGPDGRAGRTAVLAGRATGHHRRLGELAPADFLATVASELDGTSKTATYGTNFTKPLLFIEDGAYFTKTKMIKG